ncbi:unnamed protein product [Ranitomeya imitator]|uniref:ribonuclease H n=1 Tax=Ranitomeya imitator TaxID=111125 RepID=A0ABN9KXS8_9NEOB|nr:unnamed protein product [Ranitomeya imitator]
MIQARKPSSSRIYYRTWKAYFRWCESNRVPPMAGLDSGLALSSLKGQVSALSILFQKTLASRPQVAFLVAITSIRRVSELAALSCRPLFLVIHQDKVVFRPPPSFLPKVVSTFHLNEDIVLPSFFPAPTHPLERSLNKLDLVRAVRIYLDRTSSFRKTDSFFVIPDGTRRGQPASKATIARWIRMAILEAYRVKNRVPPPGIKAHSTRAVGASWAVHHRASALQLCKAATWSSIHTFAKFYKVHTYASADASLGRRILQAAVKILPNTKEPELSDKGNTSGLPMGIAWCNVNSLETNVAAKEECSSPETGLPEEVETTNLNCRGVSIADFLDVNRDENKESSLTNVSYEAELIDTLMLNVSTLFYLKKGNSILDPHPSALHDHSRSSNLSDILEEEEEVEEDCIVVPSAKKLGSTPTSTGGASSGKFDYCETDSDEEILERILDIPLQKHCSKKLFSIPEVTEEEDEDDDLSPRSVSKNLHCTMEPQMYPYGNSHRAFSPKPGTISCVNVPTDTSIKRSVTNNMKMECGDDSVFLDDDCCLKSKNCVYQSSSDTRPPVSEAQMWKPRRTSYDIDKACYFTEPNRKKQNDSREHCSRMATNSSQGVFYNSRSCKLKEPVSGGTARDSVQINHKGLKNKPSRRRRLPGSTNYKPKAPSSFSSKHLEIDVEYDTEDEDEPSVPVHITNRAKADLWEDGSQTDREGWSESSGYSEPIQHTRRKNYAKKPIKEQSAGQYVKKTPSIPKAGLASPSCNKDDPVSRAASRSVRSIRWESDGKEDLPEDTKMQLHLSPTRHMASDRRTTSHLTSDSESDVIHSTQPEYFQEKVLEDRNCPSSDLDAASPRLFVALFDYHPATMSPNPEAYMEELPFKEGQILQVFGDKDSDGFYQGKCEERTGYIPCNMVSELLIESEEARMQLLKQGHLTAASPLNDMEGASIKNPTDHQIDYMAHSAFEASAPALFPSFAATDAWLWVVHDEWVRDLVSSRYKSERFQGFYSNLFIVPKKNGTVRPILDLKLLNKFVRVRRFRMESLRSVIASMEKGEFLASIDIQDAYLHIPIFPSRQRFLRFAVQEQHFQFVALPFSFATAPRVFTKVIAAAVAILPRHGCATVSRRYPHQRPLCACKDAVSITMDSLSRLGWKINFKKSSSVPAQRISFLGMILDLSKGLVLLPPKKISALQREAQKLSQLRTHSLRFSMRVLGRIVAAMEAVPFVELHLRPLLHALRALLREEPILPQPPVLPSPASQTVSQVVDIEVLPESSEVFSSSTLASCDNRCQSSRLGSGVPTSHCSGPLVTSGITPSDQHLRNSGNQVSSSPVPSLPGRSSHQDSV